jgi:hypothetical protein
MVLREWRFWRPGYQPVDKPHPQRSCGRWRVQAEPCWPPVCLRRVPSLSVAVVDQGPLPGRGLAYGAKYDCHLRNVSRWPHERSAGSTGSFLAWGAGKLRTISASHESSTASPLWAIREFLAEGSRWARWCRNLRWIQGEVTSFARERSHVTVQLRDGSTLVTKTGLLAAGNFPPANLNVPGPSQRCI